VFAVGSDAVALRAFCGSSATLTFPFAGPPLAFWSPQSVGVVVAASGCSARQLEIHVPYAERFGVHWSLETFNE
jgi:hypothetical protein